MFEIVFMDDSHDCETCGSSYAEGYLIKKDGEVVVDKTPSASCFGGANYNQNEAYLELVKLTGIQVDVSYAFVDYCNGED